MPDQKKKDISTVFCGLATAFFVLSSIVSPIAMLIWFGSAYGIRQDVRTMDSCQSVLIMCAVALLVSLGLSIAAKVINRKGKWSIVCIVLSAVGLIVGILFMMLLIFAVSQYRY